MRTNNDYLQAIMEGRMRIQIDTKQLPDGDTRATWQDVNGQLVEHTHSDANEASRRCLDKVKLGIIEGTLHIER